MRKSGFYVVTGCVLLSLLAFTSSSGAQEPNHRISGTWIVTVTVNTPPGAPPFVFTDMITFNDGGTLLATSSAFNSHSSENPLLPAPLAADTSDGYGSWKSVPDDASRVTVTFRRFLFAGANTSTAYYGRSFPGQNVGINTVKAAGVLHTGDQGDTLSGSFTTQFLNLAGQAVFAGKGTFTAIRLE